MRFSIIAAFILPLVALARPVDLVKQTRDVGAVKDTKAVDPVAENKALNDADPHRGINADITNADFAYNLVAEGTNNRNIINLWEVTVEHVDQLVLLDECVDTPDRLSACTTSSLTNTSFVLAA
jgi:hypothetical protein